MSLDNYNYQVLSGNFFNIFKSSSLLIVGQWYPHTKKGGKRSEVWNYFKKNHELQKASCNECGYILSVKGGTTSSMKNHLRLKHLIDF